MIEYYIKATCDKCGSDIRPLTKSTSYEGLKPIKWDWQHKWKTEGVMMGLRSMFGKAKLYCKTCAG